MASETPAVGKSPVAGAASPFAPRLPLQAVDPAETTRRLGPPETARTMVESSRDLNAARRMAAKKAAKPEPEVHIIGEIVGATGFGDSAVCCKWTVEAGDRWDWLGGSKSGQTHTVHAEEGSDFAVWSHPIDVHYAAGTMQDWPRFQFQVYSQDTFGRLESLGYGVLHVPPAAGSHVLSCPIWRPVGSGKQEYSAFFLGGYPQLKSTAVLYSSARDRHRLTTTGTGTVHVEVEVIFRYMDTYGVEW